MNRHGEEYQRGATAMTEETYDNVASALCRVPKGFPIHKTVQRMLDAKSGLLTTGKGIDWATGESLAFGSLLTEGHAVRPPRPDSARGTFSLPHSALAHQHT